MPNAFEAMARSRKVSAILEILAKVSVTADEAEADIDKEVGWEVLARHAGIKMPSLETRKAVVAAMRKKEAGMIDPEPEPPEINWGDCA